jgi:diguanylate cyclase (GGDEF)-like protein
LTGLVAAYLGSRITRQHQVECLAVDLRQANEHLQGLATRDELTGLWNRRQFMEFLNLEVERVCRHRAPLALAMLDIDRFKTLNDTYGHAFGDRVLAEIGRLLRAEARSSDITARYAGDEFTILMPNTRGPEALGAVERLREALARRPVTCDEHEVAVTLSAGLCAADPGTGTSVEGFLREADVALYRAKRAGRNCVRTYDPVSRGDPAPALLNTEAVKAVREQVASLCRDSEEIFLRGTESLAQVLLSRGPQLTDRGKNVQRLAAGIAEAMGLDADQVAAIRRAAAVHDIGMVGVLDTVLRNPGPLSEDERRAMEHHVLMGIHILNPMRFLERELPMVRHHHEHWNGQGYPDGLERQAIPVGARVLAVADALEAMTSGRPYRAARRLAEALQVLQQEAGRQFDPGVVEPLVRWVRDLGQVDGGEAGLTVEDLVKRAAPVQV